MIKDKTQTVAIIVEEGIVQSIITDSDDLPSIRFIVIDYDTDKVDGNEEKLVSVPITHKKGTTYEKATAIDMTPVVKGNDLVEAVTTQLDKLAEMNKRPITGERGEWVEKNGLWHQYCHGEEYTCCGEMMFGINYDNVFSKKARIPCDVCWHECNVCGKRHLWVIDCELATGSTPIVDFYKPPLPR
jgi:hypothetical protein